MFHELNQARSNNGYGFHPISFLEIDAYNRLTGANLSPFEIELLRTADAAFLAQVSENMERERNL